ncbi:MAG: hypothetical protein QM669_08310 [Siphonobacter sp.]
MKRLSLEELKNQASLAEKSTKDLESIKGGDLDLCHYIDVIVDGLIRGLTTPKQQ